MSEKPQLIIQDFGGKNAENMEGTSARLMQGHSWKKQRVIVILPAAQTIPAKVALSHWNLAFPPNNGVMRILALGMEVGDAYSTAIENILAHPDLGNWEYLLTLEHDNAPPADGVVKLMKVLEDNPHLAAVSGLYFTKGDGGVAQIWGDVSDPMINFRPQVPRDGELQECYGIGMGFALWRLSFFKKAIPRPFFKTHNGASGEGIGTQDLTFCSKARQFGFRCAVDSSVKVGHYDLEGKFGPADTMY